MVASFWEQINNEEFWSGRKDLLCIFPLLWQILVNMGALDLKPGVAAVAAVAVSSTLIVTGMGIQVCILI